MRCCTMLPPQSCRGVGTVSGGDLFLQQGASLIKGLLGLRNLPVDLCGKGGVFLRGSLMSVALLKKPIIQEAVRKLGGR